MTSLNPLPIVAFIIPRTTDPIQSTEPERAPAEDITATSLPLAPPSQGTEDATVDAEWLTPFATPPPIRQPRRATGLDRE